MKKITIIGFITLLLFTNIFSFLFGGVFVSNSFGISSASSNDLHRKLNQVKNDLIKMYDGDVDESILIDGALKGMARSLGDTYTFYMDKQEYSDYTIQFTKKFSGIGVQLLPDQDTNTIVVIDVYRDSPAEKAGMKKNDHIIKVGDINVDATTTEKAISLMRGEEGTDVIVTVYRESIGEIALTMKRDIITIKTVDFEMIDDKIGYIQVYAFGEDTSDSFEYALENLKASNMQGLILDLRDNGGGLLDQCVSMVSNFIKKGDVVVSIKGKNYPEERLVSFGGNYIGLPMVILMNEYSASASEIFIGAMIDYRLATTVGTTSYGKGLVQTTLPYGDGTGINVTICKYYSPSGNNIQGTGFQPNIKVDYPEELYDKPYSRDEDPQFQKAFEIILSKV